MKIRNLLLLLVFILPLSSYGQEAVHIDANKKEVISTNDLILQKDLHMQAGKDYKLYSKFLSPKSDLSHSEVVADINRLIYTLNKAYIGKHYLPAGEYDTLIKSLENLKSDTSITTSEQLMDRLYGLTSKVSDNHLSVNLAQPMSMLKERLDTKKTKAPAKYKVFNKKQARKI